LLLLTDRIRFNCHLEMNMRNLIASLFVTILAVCPVPTFAEEILSKEDARQTFSMSFTEWSTNVKTVHDAGLGRAAIAGTYEWTLLMQTPMGILKVTPSYLPNQLQRPHKISIAVEQNKVPSAITRARPDAELKNMIEKWYREMLPDYTAMTNIDLMGETVQFNFTLFEKGVYPPMDMVARDTKGCWQQCIKR
jgi:hypothetical protein